MPTKIVRVVSRAPDGSIRTRDYQHTDQLLDAYEQVGLDDCSTDLSLRGLPIFKGLIGPIAESKSVALYESPDVFEFMTKEWSQQKSRRRKRRTKEEMATDIENANGGLKPSVIPTPKLMGIPAMITSTVHR